VRGRSVSGWETFSWHNEGGRVWSEVEEELAKNVESKKTVWWEFLPSKSDNTEEDSEDEETTELDGLTSNSIDSSNSDPVTRNGTSNDENNVTNCVLVENFINVTRKVSWILFKTS
jgi:hypothetical protein